MRDHGYHNTQAFLNVSGFGSAKALRVVKWSISLDGNADA
jgi:hypothetical protein